MFGIFRRGNCAINQSQTSTVVLEVWGRKPMQMWNATSEGIAATILLLAESVAQTKEIGHRFTMSLKAIPGVGTQFEENEWLPLIDLSDTVDLVDTVQLPQTDGNIQSEYVFEKKPDSATAA